MERKCRKKESVALILLITLIMALCGCSSDLTMTLKEDGSGSMTQTILIEKEYLEDTEENVPGEGFTYEDVTVDGKEYKKGVKTVTFQDFSEVEELEGYDCVFCKDFFSIKNVAAYAAAGTGKEDGLDEIQETCTITFPYEVKLTNGVLQADKKTVIWDADNIHANANNCYAVFTDTPLDAAIAAPKITGVKNNGYYKGGVEVQISSDTLIESLTVNGMVVGADLCYIFGKEGKNTVICRDVNGKTTKVSFIVDNTNPTVKGVADGKTYKGTRKITFSDKYGVKSATLNGKKISSGKKVSKKGSYKLVVKDKAGNKSVVKFKIK